jgi:hypothetical protein
MMMLPGLLVLVGAVSAAVPPAPHMFVIVSKQLPCQFSPHCHLTSVIHPNLNEVINVSSQVIDDLGWDDVNGYAGDAPEPRTPNLAQLKRDGVEMEMRTFKFCSPTRSAILTGR